MRVTELQAHSEAEVAASLGLAVGGQFEDLDSADKRAVRGNTFTYIAAVIATVSENLRRVLGFYQEHLAVRRLDSKVRNVPTTYWQSTEVASLAKLGLIPPG